MNEANSRRMNEYKKENGYIGRIKNKMKDGTRKSRKERRSK